MDKEVALAGGNWTDEVVRVGATVHRSRGPNSDFAATLLAELERLGVPFAPAYLGRDDKGRDVFTYFDGSTTEHPDQRSEHSYITGGKMLRQLHDATAGHPLAAGGECVIHGDPGPFNTIFRDGMPVGLIDWDCAKPGLRLDDLAYMAWTWCIYADSRIPLDDQARRVNELRLGYGFESGQQLLEAILRRQSEMMSGSMEMLGRDNKPETFYQHHRDAIRWAADCQQVLLDNIDSFTSALSLKSD
jgi:hypothetical protein